MTHHDRGLLEERLGRYERVLEVGIGERTGLAERLHHAGIDVLAVDIARVSVPDGVEFLRADVRSLDSDRIGPVDAVYARRLPPELHKPSARLAARAGADLYFTTLGGEFPIVETQTLTGPDETVYTRQIESDTVL